MKYVVLDKHSDGTLHIVEREEALLYKLNSDMVFVAPVDVIIKVVMAVVLDLEKGYNGYTVRAKREYVSILKGEKELDSYYRGRLYLFIYFCIDEGIQENMLKARYPTIWKELAKYK